MNSLQSMLISPDSALTRSRYDIPAMVECNDITTGPGRYRLDVPNAYGYTAYVTDPTIRIQKWGASHDMSSTKTDVESDLWNLNRPLTRAACGHYTPSQGASRTLTPMPEISFPVIASRLEDPPCTLRASGWNRWDWLGEDPQANVMMPFEWGVDSRHAAKDGFKECLMAHRRTAVAPRTDPGLPVARASASASKEGFTNQLPGIAAHAPMGAPARTQPKNPSDYKAVPATYVDKFRAMTGLMTAPPLPAPSVSEATKSLH